MNTNFLFKNQRIPESPQNPNISLERAILLGICSLPYWNGAHPSTTLQHKLTGEDVNSGGCGILVLYIQLALTNLSNVCIFWSLFTLFIPLVLVDFIIVSLYVSLRAYQLTVIIIV